MAVPDWSRGMQGASGVCMAMVLIFATVLVSAAPERLWNRQHAERQAAREITDPALNSLLGGVNDGKPEQLVFRLRELQASAQLPLPAQERVFRDLALALRERPPSEAGRHALRWLGDYKSRVYVAHEESRGTIGIPLYRVAAAARGTLAIWQHRLVLSQAQAALAEGTANKALSAEAGPHRANEKFQGLAAAFETAPLEQITPYREPLLSAVRESSELAPSAAALARRLRDRELFLAVLRSGDRLTATRLLADTRATLPPSEAYAVLTRAARNPPLASMAMMEIGFLASDVPEAREFLLASLENADHGVSAAVSLAAMQDPEIVDALAERLTTVADRDLLARVLLALRLDASPQARTILSEFANDHKAPRSLRQEVSRWLAL